MEAISVKALGLGLLLFIGGSMDGVAGPVPKVRVRIADGVRSVQVRGFDLRIRSVNRGQDLKLAQSSAVRPVPELVSWGGPIRGLAALREQAALAPAGPADIRLRQSARSDRLAEWKFACPSGGVVEATSMGAGRTSKRPIFFAGPVLIESPSGFVTVQKRPYREKVFVHPISTRKGWECEVVNHVDVENYLDGLVNAEFSAAWNRDSIDAQVISARTYALYQMKRMAAKKGGSHFDLDSTIKDQVYDGSMREDYRARMSASRTRGRVLKASNRDAWPIKAYYHSTCGGTTELPEVVWGAVSRGFRTRVQCANCRNSPTYIWDVPLAAKEIVSLVWKGARELGAAERDQIRNWPVSWERELRESRLLELRVTQQNASGRAEVVTSRWKNAAGTEFVLAMPGTLFRYWIGPSRLKSTVFQVLAAGNDQWVLRGRGFGHGVGLCQWGAKTLGEKGKPAHEILKFYYPDAVIAKVW